LEMSPAMLPHPFSNLSRFNARSAKGRPQFNRRFQIVLSLGMAACLLATTPHAQAQTAQPQTGVRTIPTEANRSGLGPGSCTIDVYALDGSGASLANGETSQYSVNFNPPLTVPFAARLVFDWPSTLPGFEQRTIRTEKFPAPDPGTAIVGFVEVEIAPTAGAISGTCTVSLVLTAASDSGTQLFCTATTRGNVGF
jgi:hypothetical protein